MSRMIACPEVSQYGRLASGKLSDAEKEALLCHLEGCDACAGKIAALPEQDTLVGLLRHADTVDEVSGRAVDRLIDRLSKLRPGEVPPPREPASALLLTFACPSCGKGLKVKGTLAGQKVQCPFCKKAAQLSAVSASAAPAARSTAPQPPSLADRATLGGAKAPSKLGGTGDYPSVTAKDRVLYDFLAPPQAPDELGRLGPYRVLAVLGAGGMGVVFRAEDPQLARLVALKAMLPGLAASEGARQRFLREARAAAAISHDHIIAVYQVGEDRGVPYLAMPFLEGEPLDRRLQREGKLPVAEVMRIGREIALGLAAAHRRELIHRDIKPANIWLESQPGELGASTCGGRVKILDFGLARAIRDECHLTQLGAIVGTPAYMAPEQGQGKSVDARCDLFSLGCVLYRMATGKTPFQGTDVISTLMAVATHHPAPPHEQDGALPTPLSELIMRLLAKEAGDRPASAQAVAETLNRLAREQANRPAAREPKAEPLPAPPVPRTPSPVVDRSPFNDLVDLPTPNRSSKKAKSGRAVAKPATKKKWPIAVGVAACFMLVLVVLWSAGVFKLKTKDGTIVLENLPADAEVLVDGEKVSVKLAGDGKPIEIQVAPGKRKLQIKTAGFKMETKEVTLASGERKPIGIRLERLPVVAKPKAPEVALPSSYKNRLGMKFVLVGKGTAWLGGGGGKPGEKKVEIPHDFYLGVYEVTQEEWQAVTATPHHSHYSRNGPGKDAVKHIPNADLNRFPVELVSWDEAQLFLRLLNTQAKEVGWVYRLPKEAEWEYACRGGPLCNKLDSRFHYYLDKPTNQLGLGQANFDDGKGLKRTCKVGSYKPNRLGLYDMHGNVWEWCDDEQFTPQGASVRVVRGGGCWGLGSGGGRAASPGASGPSHRCGDLGLRVARVRAIRVP